MFDQVSIRELNKEIQAKTSLLEVYEWNQDTLSLFVIDAEYMFFLFTAFQTVSSRALQFLAE